MTESILYSHMRTLNSTPEHRIEPWPDLCARLDDSAQVPCDPMMKNGLKKLTDDEYLTRFGVRKTKAKLPSILSPIFLNGDSRLAENVYNLGNLFIADIDHAPISFEDMASNLDDMGINYYLYPTTNHTVGNPSYRLLLPLDRDMEVDEYPHLWDAMNYKFENTFDTKTKDIVRMGFMPRDWGGKHQPSRHALNKSHIIIKDVLAAYPVTQPLVAPSSGGKVNQSSTSVTSNVVTLQANLNRPSDINIEDYELCPYVTDGAKQAYEQDSGRYFTFMMRVATAALKDRYDIQPAELMSLANQADRAFGVVDERIDALREAERAIEKSREYLGSNITQLSSTVAPEDFKSPVVPKTTDMVVKYIDATCGAGKSYGMIEYMLKNKGKYIYACDKISALKQRHEDFNKMLTEQYPTDILSTESAKKFKAQSNTVEDEFGSDEVVDDSSSVMKLIAQAGFNINKKIASGEISTGVIFITHRAAQMMDWSQFKDYELIIDEVPDVFSTFSRSYAKSTMSYIEKYLNVGAEDRDAYLMKLTPAGRKFLDSGTHDDIRKSIVGLMRNAGDDLTNLWVMKDGWDRGTAISNGDDDNQAVALTFFSLFMPESLRPFKQVYLLGDELLKSRFRHAWEKIGGVDFVEAGFWDGGQKRTKLLMDRATIYYFMDKGASFGKFEAAADPLSSISKWLVTNVKSPILYSCNKRFRSNTEALEEHGAEYISPKAHGLNGYQKYSILVWLAAMRSSGQEYNITRRLINMTAEELDRDKEFNAAYQMVMRGVLRKFYSNDHCDIYVVSKAQAEYLSERLDGCEIKHIKGVVIEKPKNTSGSKRTAAERKDANTKSSQKWRDKKKKEKEQMEGPKKPPLTGAERSERFNEKKKSNETTKNSVSISPRTGLRTSTSGIGTR